jgi:cold shock CspA family protein
MQRRKAIINIWHEDVQWGFAITPEGKNLFVHKSAFRDHRQVPRVRYGTQIEFDLPVTQGAEQAFRDKLNAGKYRDDVRIAQNYRNPRCKTIKNKKPRAVNVSVTTE